MSQEIIIIGASLRAILLSLILSSYKVKTRILDPNPSLFSQPFFECPFPFIEDPPFLLKIFLEGSSLPDKKSDSEKKMYDQNSFPCFTLASIFPKEYENLQNPKQTQIQRTEKDIINIQDKKRPSLYIYKPLLFFSLAQEALKRGVSFTFSEKILSIEEKKGSFRLLTSSGEYEPLLIINTLPFFQREPHTEEALSFQEKVRKRICFLLNFPSNSLPSKKKESSSFHLFFFPFLQNHFFLSSPFESLPSQYFFPEKPELEKAYQELQEVFHSNKISQSWILGYWALPFWEGKEKDSVIYPLTMNWLFFPSLDSSVTSAIQAVYNVMDLIFSKFRLTLKKGALDTIPLSASIFFEEPCSFDEEDIQNLWRKDCRYGHLVCPCKGTSEGDLEVFLGSPLIPFWDDFLNVSGLGKGKCFGQYCQEKLYGLREKYKAFFSLSASYEKD